MIAVILAAGRGKRLKPLTLKRSKAMQPIMGKPMVERVMEGIYGYGIKRFIVVVSPGDAHLQDHLRNNLSFEPQLKFVYQEEQKGMGHAVQQAAPFITEDFVLSACDNLVPQPDLVNFLDYWQARQPLHGLLSTLEIPDEDIPVSGIVVLDGKKVVHIVEKPGIAESPGNIASVPLYCFSKDFVPHLNNIPLSKRGEYELQDAIQTLIKDTQAVHGFAVSDRLTVSTPADLLYVNRYYLKHAAQSQKIIADNVAINGTNIVPPVYIGSDVSIGKGGTIGPEVYIEAGCSVGSNVTLKHAIMLDGAILTDNATIEEEVVFPDYG